MPFLRTVPDNDSLFSHRPRHPRTSLFNSLRHVRQRRRHSAPSTQVSTHPFSNSPADLKPIYIYPGLLRIVREKAIALDNQCPAGHYKCRKCDEQSFPTQPMHQCEHDVSCSVCLEKFHGKDLVRRLPCNDNHVFHSKCILDWFAFQQRCPLCNEYVSNSLHSFTAPRSDSSTLAHDVRHRLVEERRDVRQRLLRFLGVDVNLLRFTRDITNASPPHRTLPVNIDDLFCPFTPSHEQRRFQSSPQIRHELHQQNGSSSSGRNTVSSTNSASDAGKWQQKPKGPRTYSYIVHDNVRVEMNTRIPV